MTAYNEGFDSFNCGMLDHENPYARYTSEHALWAFGWTEAAVSHQTTMRLMEVAQ